MTHDSFLKRILLGMYLMAVSALQLCPIIDQLHYALSWWSYSPINVGRNPVNWFMWRRFDSGKKNFNYPKHDFFHEECRWWKSYHLDSFSKDVLALSNLYFGKMPSHTKASTIGATVSPKHACLWGCDILILKKNHDQRLTQTPAEIPIVQGNMLQGTRWAPLIDGMTPRILFLSFVWSTVTCV